MSNATPIIISVSGRASLLIQTTDGTGMSVVQSSGNATPARFVDSGAASPAFYDVSFDAATIDWEDAVIANGGSVSFNQKVLVNNFIVAEKAEGIWDLTDDYWPLWCESSTQALTSLKQLRLATAVSAPTFTPYQGYNGNASSSYINTGFVLSTHSSVLTGTNNRLSIYVLTNENTGSVRQAGVVAATNGAFSACVRNGASSAVNNISGQITYTLPTSGPRGQGYFSYSRNGATIGDCAGYRNGVALTRGGSPTFTSTLPAQPLYILARNSSGTADLFSGAVIGFCAVGAQLSAGQELAHFNNVQAWASAIGAAIAP